METAEFEAACASTAIYEGAGEATFSAITYTVLGLTGEAGEVANKWKKTFRELANLEHCTHPPGEENCPREQLRQKMIDELGDVLWYAARLAAECESDLDEIMRNNMAKLASRKERGVLGGSGDNR